MPEIDARIASFLEGKLAPPAKPAGAAAVERVRSGVVHALIAALTRVDLRLAGLEAWLQGAAGGRGALHQELADHLRDAYERQLELGSDPEAAWDFVTRHFGDYEAILGELETLHRPAPLWEVVTRLLALPAACLYAVLWTGVSPRDVFNPVFLIVMLVAAPLAAWEARDWGWPAWTRWTARGLGFWVFCFSFRLLGFSWSESLAALGMGVAGVAGFRSFRPARFTTRLREIMMILMMTGMSMGVFAVFKYANEPSDIGMAIAITFIIIVYGVLLARPGLGVLALAAGCCQGAVWLGLRACGMMELAKTGALPEMYWKFLEPLNWGYFQGPVIYALLGLMATWAFYGRRDYGRWFAAAGVIAMILVYIDRLKNLDRLVSVPGIMVGASLPLLLWVIPAGMGVWGRIRKNVPIG